DSVVWVNGHRLGRHESGFTSFRYDVSDVINYGVKNVVAVRVDATQYEGWWYDGAGIYRHVWLSKTDPVHVGPWGTFVTSVVGKTSAEVTIETTIFNESDEPVNVELTSTITDTAGKSIGSAKSKRTRVEPWS